MAIDIRGTLDRLLWNWGHNILLERQLENGCYSNTMELHTVRYTYPSTRGLPQIQREEMEGIIRVVDLMYYFRRDAKPKEGDRIYEPDERFRYGGEVYLIDYSIAINGRNGEVDYYVAGCTRDHPN